MTETPHEDDTFDPATGGEPANQGPVPAEPEDAADTGEGLLAPQAVAAEDDDSSR